MKPSILTALALGVVLCLAGCSRFKPNPVTWEDIARTIPADPKYVGSINVAFEADSAFNDVWDKDDITRLIAKGLSLDSVRPSHIVVVAMEKATFVTWPIPNPRAVAEKAADWTTASLNNTPDARILVQGKASLVLSTTQAWVVNNVHGEKFVNELLSAAMNTKAAHVIPFYNCITSTPADGEAVIPYNNRYYAVRLNHDDGQLRVDVDAYDKAGHPMVLVDSLGRLPQADIADMSPVSPFAAAQFERGTMPEWIVRLSKLSDDTALSLKARVVAPLFTDAAGTVIARWNAHELEIKVPFISREAAFVAAKNLKTIARAAHSQLIVSDFRDTLTVRTPFTSALTGFERVGHTPRRHTQTDNPSAVAFVRFDFGFLDPAEAYFELAPTHARFQLDYINNTYNLAKATNLTKQLVFKML